MRWLVTARLESFYSRMGGCALRAFSLFAIYNLRGRRAASMRNEHPVCLITHPSRSDIRGDTGNETRFPAQQNDFSSDVEKYERRCPRLRLRRYSKKPHHHAVHFCLHSSVSTKPCTASETILYDVVGIYST